MIANHRACADFLTPKINRDLLHLIIDRKTSPFNKDRINKKINKKVNNDIKKILQNVNLDINFKYKNNESILTIAAAESKTEVFKLIFDRDDVDINLTSWCGTNAIFYACRNNNIEILSMLLAKPNIDPNCKTLLTHETPLSVAILNNYVKIVEMLINCPNIDVNGIFDFNKSPLILAVENKRIKIIELLLTSDSINLTYRNYYSKQTALGLAIKNKNKIIISMLQNHQLL